MIKLEKMIYKLIERSISREFRKEKLKENKQMRRQNLVIDGKLNCIKSNNCGNVNFLPKDYCDQLKKIRNRGEF